MCTSIVGINIELGDGKTIFFQVLSFYEQENSAENGVGTLLFWILCVGFSQNAKQKSKKSVSLYPFFYIPYHTHILDLVKIFW